MHLLNTLLLTVLSLTPALITAKYSININVVNDNQDTLKSPTITTATTAKANTILIDAAIYSVISTSQKLTLALHTLNISDVETLKAPIEEFTSSFKTLAETETSDDDLSVRQLRLRNEEISSLRYFVVDVLNWVDFFAKDLEAGFKEDLAVKLENVADLKDGVVGVVVSGVKNELVQDVLKNEMNQVFGKIVGTVDALRGAEGPRRIWKGIVKSVDDKNKERTKKVSGGKRVSQELK